jgi:hypothetical protein
MVTVPFVALKDVAAKPAPSIELRWTDPLDIRVVLEVVDVPMAVVIVTADEESVTVRTSVLKPPAALSSRINSPFVSYVNR